MVRGNRVLGGKSGWVRWMVRGNKVVGGKKWVEMCKVGRVKLKE